MCVCGLQPLAYMCVHISLTNMTFALCKLWWANYYAHTAFLLFVFAISAWNGEPSHPVVCSLQRAYRKGMSLSIPITASIMVIGIVIHLVMKYFEEIISNLGVDTMANSISKRSPDGACDMQGRLTILTTSASTTLPALTRQNE